MRTGVFGGTFDPVHVGHLIIAEQCREQAELDRVLFVPAARPPHKSDQGLTSFTRRVEMLELATAGNPKFGIDQLEKERSGLSYTADTLTELHGRYPGSELFFILGSDSLADLPHWREPARIAELATLLIWERPGHAVRKGEQGEEVSGLPQGAAWRLRVVQGPHIDVASRDLRQRAAQGRSLRYVVPRAVEAYIEQHGLYKNTGGQA